MLALSPIHEYIEMNDFIKLDQYIRELYEHVDPFGVAIAIVRNNQIASTKVFGRYENQMLWPDTPFAVASLTKPIFAYGVLQLHERGIFDIDIPLSQYLPEPYLPAEPNLPFMTARHALSHTTGFPNWRNESSLQSLFYPGSAFHYSTEGLLYLQNVVEYLIQQPIDVYLKHNVFEPLGMKNSQLVPEDLSDWNSFLPKGHRAYGGLSLVTTASDYACFLIEMMRRNDNDARFLLNQATISQMLTPQIRVGDQNDLTWGLGWGLQHIDGYENSFWHFGVRRGHMYNFAVGNRDTQSGVVVLTHQVVGLSICEEITRIALGHSKDLPAFRWLLPPEKWRADGKIPGSF